jgi:hypothetical protein
VLLHFGNSFISLGRSESVFVLNPVERLCKLFPQIGGLLHTKVVTRYTLERHSCGKEERGPWMGAGGCIRAGRASGHGANAASFCSPFQGFRDNTVADSKVFASEVFNKRPDLVK